MDVLARVACLYHSNENFDSEVEVAFAKWPILLPLLKMCFSNISWFLEPFFFFCIEEL